VSTSQAYGYVTPSVLSASDAGADLALATSGGVATDGSPVAHPYFFSGFAERPDVVATALLAVARVARTRYYVPPNTLAAVLRAADPVVTSTPEGLRFESFSVCCGVYARLDVLADGLDTAFSAAGVTNVDVNPPLRQALAGLRAAEPLHLSVGAEELRVSTLDAEVVEEKVPLPDRWLKGFAETQVLAAGMRLRHELDAVSARRFVQALPATSATRTVMWATAAVRSLRLATRPSPGAVCVAGPERLRALEPLLGLATGLRAYGPDVNASSRPVPSVWVLDLPGARLSLALSPEKARGFSGEGAVLLGLTGTEVVEDADLIAALLAFEPRIDVDRLAAEADLPADRVAAALGVLATSGQVGYDVAAGAYFHRPLPLDSSTLAVLHPRLAGAQTLVREGGVRALGAGRFAVRASGGGEHEVRLADDADVDRTDRCTCPWFAKHRGTRGPCTHVLAARMTTEVPA
jgi:hypothetical protein